jgi:threonine dehydratase
MTFDVSLADIRAAAARIRGHVRETPTYVSDALGARLGRRTIVKFECLQRTGAFKLRGAVNKLLTMSAAERAAGVVTVSGGNQAISLSSAASALGVDALVLMPKAAAPFNIALTKAAGGAVELHEDAIAAFAAADAHVAAGRTNVHGYDDPVVIAGNGTVGLEMGEAAPDLTHVFVSIGGGGFAAGVAAALKGLQPSVTVIGVETEGATTMTQALAANAPVPIRPTSIARTLGAPFATARTLAAARAFLDRIEVVSDKDTVASLVDILQAERVLVEPAAACVLTAAERLAPSLPADAVVGLVLCGSNVALEDVAAWRASFGV